MQRKIKNLGAPCTEKRSIPKFSPSAKKSQHKEIDNSSTQGMKRHRVQEGGERIPKIQIRPTVYSSPTSPSPICPWDEVGAAGLRLEFRRYPRSC